MYVDNTWSVHVTHDSYVIVFVRYRYQVKGLDLFGNCRYDDDDDGMSRCCCGGGGGRHFEASS